jgi:hypothetical protein
VVLWSRPFLHRMICGVPPTFGDLAACFAETGGFRFMPWALADARPLAFNPPLGFLPSFLVHAAVFGIICSSLSFGLCFWVV